MARVSLDRIQLAYDDLPIVHSLTLELAEGELGCLLGPSGCGKSSILRAIAGLLKPAAGQVRLGDLVASDTGTWVEPEARQVGFVFQDVALFPHLSVRDNVAFGLHRWKPAERDARIEELLQLVELSGLAARYPHELSGGQQQRVALARAMAPRPRVLLLDEPFSGLDAALKGQLVIDVRRILKTDGVTGIMVTHDRKEAFDFADKIAVLRDGALEQFDTPYRLYHEPNTLFVAQFVGAGDILEATSSGPNAIECALGCFELPAPHGLNDGDPVKLLVRPDDLIHDDDAALKPLLVSKQFRGSHFEYRVRFEQGLELGCLAPSHHDHQIGEAVGVRIELEHLVLLTG